MISIDILNDNVENPYHIALTASSNKDNVSDVY